MNICSRLFFGFHEELANEHIYETIPLSEMHGLCEGSIFLQLHSSYLFGSLTCFFNYFFFIIYLGIPIIVDKDKIVNILIYGMDAG